MLIRRLASRFNILKQGARQGYPRSIREQDYDRLALNTRREQYEPRLFRRPIIGPSLLRSLAPFQEYQD